MGDVATVFTVDSNSVARVQPVKTGVSGGGLTEILGGLNEGDQVVAAGLEFLRDGQTVNVMEDRT
jgi:multidrug efflux pump subunit AcrA (membrane-fusion protein)